MKKLLAVVVVLVLVGGTASAEGKISLGVGPDVLLPMGTFGDAVNIGFGGSVRGQYDFTPMFSAGLTVGYFTWSAKDQTGGLVKMPTLKGLPIRVYGKYYFMPEGGARFYGIAELGFFIASVTVPAQTITIGGFTYSTPEVSNSETDFNYAPGVGVELPMGSGNTKLDISVRYDGIATSGNTSGSLAARVGINFGLGN